MHIEVQVALNFVISYLYNKLPRRRVNIFGEELEKALKAKFQGHWYPEKPFKVRPPFINIIVSLLFCTTKVSKYSANKGHTYSAHRLVDFQRASYDVHGVHSCCV